MKIAALKRLARQLRTDPNPDAIEDAATALEDAAESPSESMLRELLILASEAAKAGDKDALRLLERLNDETRTALYAGKETP